MTVTRWAAEAVKADATLLVRLTGEFDVSNADDLAAWIHRATVEKPSKAVSLDLSGVTFLDSSTVRVLVESYRQATDAGTTFQVTHPTGLVRRVLEVTGVWETLHG